MSRRLQKIGDHCRAFKRTAMSGNWKTNMGTSTVEELPMTPEYAAWLELAAGMFGGLDICTVDAIHDAATGKVRTNKSSPLIQPSNDHGWRWRSIMSTIRSRLRV